MTFAEWLGFQNLASLTIERGILHEFAEGCGPERLTLRGFSKKHFNALTLDVGVLHNRRELLRSYHGALRLGCWGPQRVRRPEGWILRSKANLPDVERWPG